MAITIRPGMPGDAALLAELAARTFYETFAKDNRAEDLDAYLAYAFGESQQLSELLNPDMITLFAEIDGQKAGYAQLRFGETPECVTGDAPMELWRFYIAQDWHGQGLAQQLMQNAKLKAAQRGARTLWLGVWERNERAKAFYKKCGFIDVGSHVFVLGTDAQTDRIMTTTI